MLEVLVLEVDEARSRVVVTLPVAADEAESFTRRRSLIAGLRVGEVRTSTSATCTAWCMRPASVAQS